MSRNEEIRRQLGMGMPMAPRSLLDMQCRVRRIVAQKPDPGIDQQSCDWKEVVLEKRPTV